MSRSTVCRIAGIALLITVAVVAIGISVADPTQPNNTPPRFIDNVPMTVNPSHTLGVVGEKTQVCSSSRYVSENSTQALLFGGKAPIKATLGLYESNVSMMNSAHTADNGIVWYENTARDKTMCAHFLAPRQGTYQVVFMDGDEILEINNFVSAIPPS